MALRLTHYFHPYTAHDTAIHAHPHAHQIGFAAALIGLIGIPLGPMIVPSLLAVILGSTAVLLSMHPAPGMNARPEGWVGIVTGILGLVFGLVQVLVQMNL
jgi:hypothetical protein